MKVLQHKKQILPVLLAGVLVVAATVGSALAYFTTYVTAKGGYTLHLGETTTIEEKFAEWTKQIAIKNTGDTPCFVRVKVFCGSKYADLLKYSGSANWAPAEDGYYVYNAIVPAGGQTEQLDVKIDGVPADATDSFNVIVVQESTAVLYKADGTAYADWSAKLDTTTDSYDVEGAQG